MQGSDAARLADLLDSIHKALLSGDLPALAATASEMEAALSALAPGTREADLLELRRKAARNASCLRGTLRGIRAARRRLAEIAAAGTGLRTYNSKGQRNEAECEMAGRLAQRL